MAEAEAGEALASLLESPGWRLFCDFVAREWGPAGHTYAVELDKALDLTDPAAAASQARQIRAGRRIIERLLRWPDEELRRLRAPLSEPTQSRRGGL